MKKREERCGFTYGKKYVDQISGSEGCVINYGKKRYDGKDR